MARQPASLRTLHTSPVAVRPVAAARTPTVANLLLSAQLRRSTQAIHAHTEAAFELDRWLADRASYAALLTMLWGFHAGAESALDRVDGWDVLTPSIDLAARRRAFRIEQDLAELDAPAAVALPVNSTFDAMGLRSLAEGLGCLYVLEGSGLGGRVIAARARAVLGPDLPAAFFADPDRNLGQDWNALRASLDAFGAAEDASARRHVIDAAHRTFATFGATFARSKRDGDRRATPEVHWFN